MLYTSPSILSPSSVIKAELIITSNINNLNLKNWVMSQIGWDGVRPIEATVTVASGVIIGSIRPYGYGGYYSYGTILQGYTGFSTGDFPTDSVVNLIVEAGAYIVGHGGSAVDRDKGVRKTGGDAMWITSPISIWNYGIISGGGGGGGNSVYWGGSGGAGWDPGYGGGERNYGGNASLTTGGSAGGGGRGGNLGANGNPGDWGARGLAGYAVNTGNSLVTWQVVGDRRGSVY
jgi:hypothetical protein